MNFPIHLSVYNPLVSCTVSEIWWVVGPKSHIFLPHIYLAPPSRINPIPTSLVPQN